MYANMIAVLRTLYPCSAGLTYAKRFPDFRTMWRKSRHSDHRFWLLARLDLLTDQKLCALALAAAKILIPNPTDEQRTDMYAAALTAAGWPRTLSPRVTAGDAAAYARNGWLAFFRDLHPAAQTKIYLEVFSEDEVVEAMLGKALEAGIPVHANPGDVK